MEKQERLLSQQPAVVVATPGRLWSLMSEVSLYMYALVLVTVFMYPRIIEVQISVLLANLST